MRGGDQRAAAREGLRRAVRWVAEQGRRDARTLEEAARRFDLSPLDQEFLRRHFGEGNRGAHRGRS